jgi:hypothetical protein
MNDIDQRKLNELRVANLAGRLAFHLEGSTTRCVVVESVETDRWGLAVRCRPVSVPGLPTTDEEPFSVVAAWETVGASAESIFAYFASWRLIIDEPTVAKAKALVADCISLEAAREVVRSLAT